MGTTTSRGIDVATDEILPRQRPDSSNKCYARLFHATMSELQRAWARQKVALPGDRFGEVDYVPELPEHAEHPDDDSSSASSVSSTGTIIPSPTQRLFARPQGISRGKNLEQIPWTTYFERELYLSPET